MAKDNGGPAFPKGDDSSPQDGMMLRDYFAQVAPVEWLQADQAAKVVGRPCPLSDKDPVGWMQFWSEYEAKARYMIADAMLAERSK